MATLPPTHSNQTNYHGVSGSVLKFYKEKEEGKHQRLGTWQCRWCGYRWEFFDASDGSVDLDGLRGQWLQIEGHMQAHNGMLQRMSVEEHNARAKEHGGSMIPLPSFEN